MKKNYSINEINATNVNIMSDSEQLKEHTSEQQFAKYDKRVKTYSELCDYVNEAVKDFTVFYSIDMKQLKNKSLSVKYRDANKRICRIDSAYNKIKIVTDRSEMFSSLKCEKHTRSDFRTYYTITCSADDFEQLFEQICKNAKILEA